MNVPFQFSITYVATPVIKKILNNTDNLILAGIDNFSGSAIAVDLATFNLIVPAAPFYLTGFSLTVDTDCLVEFGVVNAAGSTFIPVYASFATEAVAGGIVRDLGDGFLLPHDVTNWLAAVRVTGNTGGTIRVGGDIKVFPK